MLNLYINQKEIAKHKELAIELYKKGFAMLVIVAKRL